jgi:NAD(P)-dependent dehydrogenase (short-subunit alcohol dehydrogenase family)
MSGLTTSFPDISGASSGIGLATLKEFAAHGALVVAADVKPLPPEAAALAIFQQTNLAVWAEQVALFEFVSAKFGHIDIVFLNAGVYETDPVFADVMGKDGSLKEPEYTTLRVNLVAQISGTKLAIHHLRKQKNGGAVVITGSGKCKDLFRSLDEFVVLIFYDRLRRCWGYPDVHSRETWSTSKMIPSHCHSDH